MTAPFEILKKNNFFTIFGKMKSLEHSIYY